MWVSQVQVIITFDCKLCAIRSVSSARRACMATVGSVSAARPLCRQCRRAGRHALRVAASATQAPPAVFSVPGMPRIDLRELTTEAGSAEVMTGFRDVKVFTWSVFIAAPCSLLLASLLRAVRAVGRALRAPTDRPSPTSLGGAWTRQTSTWTPRTRRACR